ncbi:hypothetical protein SODALDRAFT_326030 [Sodiomyces alkalinus F11]|uniref:Uncharacterized protein n=1 Tax=Sodiomyces alkalinus (strain CBS 110278 / VKM F-3762 / F11) TaxID=1314773 RepID=A0A3N2Q4Z1_SODAK|nr:hypothetical protein SODALDRAFT_326030 [Sodiomyces alkalinus F11]ROT41843.1 hypothetical protein SODALDRAFT_326030 [Sodiomyces alkalinus F11]
MGLLSFLSPRRTPDESLGGSLTNTESRPYNTTAPSLAPVKGTYPVAGNGLGTLKKSHLKSSQRSLALDDASENSAPAPFVPLFRELSVERPQTAPHEAGPSPGDTRRELRRARSRRESFLSQPVPARKASPETGSIASTTYSTTYSIPESVRQIPSMPHLRLHSSAVSVANTSKASTPSVSSGHGFVDLLDAQSELRPLNFHCRVRAAGARDYSEDVADRNLGENGVDLTSPQVQAFYAEMYTTAAQRPSTASPLSHSQKPAAGTLGASKHLFHPVTRSGHPMSVLNPLTQNPVTAADQEFLASCGERIRRRLSETGPAGLGRRQSLGPCSPYSYSYATSSSRLPGKQTARPETMHRPNQVASAMSEAKGSPRTTTSYGSLSTDARADSDTYAHADADAYVYVYADADLDIRNHPAPTFSPQLPPPLPSFARDSVLLARTNYSLPLSLRTSEGSLNEELCVKSSAHKTSSAVSDQHLHPDGMPTISSANRPSSRRLSRPRSLRLDMPGGPPLAASAIRHHLDTGRVFPLASASYTMRHGHLQSYGWEEPFEKTKSLAGSIYGRSALDETYEEMEIPIRSSSRHQWSVSPSNTPTVSSISSPFLRPQSHHTPDTSIDMMPVLSEKTSYSRQSRSSSASRTEDDRSSYRTALEPTAHEVNALSRKPFSRLNVADVDAAEDAPMFGNSITFHIDGYLDSESDVNSDSVTGGGRARGECEGPLLFRDTWYGMGGLQLPGLFDAIPTVPTKSRSRDDQGPRHSQQMRSSSTPPPVPRRARSAAMAGTFRGVDRGLSWTGTGTSTCHDYSEDEEIERKGHTYSSYERDEDATFSDSGSSVYEPSVPVDVPLARKGSVRRLSAIGGVYDAASVASQEHGWERVDVRTAVRLRKEAKAKLRADGVLTPRSGHRGIRRELSRGRTLDRNIHPG